MSSTIGAKVKGYLKNLDTGEILKFQYNPETFEHSRGATYSDIVSPGMSYPDAQYVHGNAVTFSIELFIFDKPYTGVYAHFLKFLQDFLPPEMNNSTFKKPPEALICYGNFIKRCIILEIAEKIEEYDEQGNEVNARITLSLRQVGA